MLRDFRFKSPLKLRIRDPDPHNNFMPGMIKETNICNLCDSKLNLISIDNFFIICNSCLENLPVQDEILRSIEQKTDKDYKIINEVHHKLEKIIREKIINVKSNNLNKIKEWLCLNFDILRNDFLLNKDNLEDNLEEFSYICFLYYIKSNSVLNESSTNNN